MIEGSNQAGLLREHHAITEHVTRHITNTDGGEFLRLAVMAQLRKVALDGLPRAAGGNAHRLVVVPDRAAGCERIAQPEPVLGADRVRGIGECGGSLIGSDHQVVVVPVAGHNTFGAYHGLGAVSRHLKVVGHIQQGADEHLVGFAALSDPGVTVHGRIRQLLGVETALGAGGNNHGVLHHLRLDQAQHLGAEVVAAIRPAQAAAGHVTKAQVHALHARGVYENLVLGVRQGRENEFLGGDLKRQGFTVKVCVGAQHGADHAGQ